MARAREVEEMKTLAELKAERYSLRDYIDEGHWLGKKRYLEGQISIMREVEPLLKKLRQKLDKANDLIKQYPVRDSMYGERVKDYLAKLEGK